jgi:transcriptional regulator with XRE-family HTH domain
MSQALSLIKALQTALRQHRKTYADVAQALGLSEVSVKRLFAKKDLSLNRLEQICLSIGLTLSELVESANRATPPISQLTPEQEQELASDIKLVVVAYLALNRWQFDEIMRYYAIDQHELTRLLARLERLNILQLLPLNRIRLLTSRNFSWRKDGPIQKIYEKQVQLEFFNDTFEDPNETFVFLGGALSDNSLAKLTNSLQELVREFDVLAEQDQKLPRNMRRSTGALLALRPIEFTLFKKYKRPDAPK